MWGMAERISQNRNSTPLDDYCKNCTIFFYRKRDEKGRIVGVDEEDSTKFIVDAKAGKEKKKK
jgi:hypothetical protein